MKATVVKVGPVFSGLAEAEIEAGVQAVMDTVAQVGENRIHNTLGQVLQHPTGFYESRIHTDRSETDRTITDTPVVYGPWLELGRSNRPTRFKGYATFRKVSDSLNADAGTLAEIEIAKVVHRING